MKNYMLITTPENRENIKSYLIPFLRTKNQFRDYYNGIDFLTMEQSSMIVTERYHESYFCGNTYDEIYIHPDVKLSVNEIKQMLPCIRYK